MSLKSASSFAPHDTMPPRLRQAELVLSLDIQIDVRLRVWQHLAVRRESDVRRVAGLDVACTRARSRRHFLPSRRIVGSGSSAARQSCGRIRASCLVPERRQICVIEKSFVVGRRLAAQPFKQALDSAGEVRDEIAAELAARVRKSCRVTRGRRHHQESDALHAGAGDDDGAAADFAFLLMDAMQVAYARRAILVRHHDFPDDAVGEDGDTTGFFRGCDMDVGRVVLGDDIAAGHAVAAEVAGEARLGRQR